MYYGKGYASTGAVPYRTSAYLASTNALLSQATYTNSFVSPAAKRFWVKVAGIRENLVLEGRTTSAAHEYDNFGNITQSTVTNGVETAVTATVYGAYPPGYPTSPHR